MKITWLCALNFLQVQDDVYFFFPFLYLINVHNGIILYMKKLYVANWKSNKTREEVEQWINDFDEQRKVSAIIGNDDNTIVLCPPMPSLMFVSNRLIDRKLHHSVYLGVQDVSPYPAGSYTGAVSTQNLDGFDVKYAIIGHSERRKYFHETSQEIANKVDQCLEAGITPIVCVDRDQIDEQARKIDESKRKHIIVAYEPVEYIGTGTAQKGEEVLEVVAEVRKAFGKDSQVLYGGSVNPENIEEFKSQVEIDGFLVGSASLDVDKFLDLIS